MSYTIKCPRCLHEYSNKIRFSSEPKLILDLDNPSECSRSVVHLCPFCSTRVKVTEDSVYIVERASSKVKESFTNLSCTGDNKYLNLTFYEDGSADLEIFVNKSPDENEILCKMHCDYEASFVRYKHFVNVIMDNLVRQERSSVISAMTNYKIFLDALSSIISDFYTFEKEC